MSETAGTKFGRKNSQHRAGRVPQNMIWGGFSQWVRKSRPEFADGSAGGGRITARTPAVDERRTLDIPKGIPLLIVETGDSTEILPADRAIIEISAK